MNAYIRAKQELDLCKRCWGPDRTDWSRAVRALADLLDTLDEVRAYDDAMCAEPDPRVPTGDDYNHVVRLLGVLA